MSDYSALYSGGTNLMSYMGNIQMQKRQAGINERLDATKWQRSVNDMKAAGINPLYLTGSGASAPSVGLPSFGVNPITSGVKDMAQARKDTKELERISANIDVELERLQTQQQITEKTRQEVAEIKERIKLVAEEAELKHQQGEKTQQEIKHIDVLVNTLEERLPKERTKGKVWSGLENGLGELYDSISNYDFYRARSREYEARREPTLLQKKLQEYWNKGKNFYKATEKTHWKRRK